MKNSEIIRNQIEALKAEDKALVKSMVFENPERTAENHNQLWSKYWEEHGWPNHKKVEELEYEMYKELNREIEVGDGVTMCLWSDRHAYTVIARTAKTLTIQQDKATLDPNFKPEWIPGGFAGHCTNSEDQEWSYERDPNGRIEKCRWSEKYGRWQTGSDGSIKIIRGRHEYHDYNF
jgi:hypothetical protein